MTKNRIRFAFIMMFTVAIGFSMTACGSTTPKPQQTDPAVEAAAEEIVEAVKAEVEKEEDEIEEIEDIEEEVDVEEDIPDEEELFDDVEPFDAYSVFNKDAEIEETVLYDENGVKITANSLLYGNYGISLNVTLENNSDKKLTFVAESLGYSVNAVNGFMIEDGYLLDEIEAGQSVKDEIEFSYMELYFAGIQEIAEVQVGFSISDEDYNHVYTGPLVVRTPLADSYDFDNNNFRINMADTDTQRSLGYNILQFSDEEIYSSNGVRILSEGYMVNKDGDRTLLLEVKNDTDKIVFFQTEKIKVNGTEIYDGRWSSDCITQNKRMIVSIELDRVLDEEEWEEKGIDEVETIGFSALAVEENGNLAASAKDLEISVK